MSANSSLDQDTLATLSDEEREAIASSEYSEAELETMKNLAGDASDDDNQDDDDSDDDSDDDAADAASQNKAEDAAPPAAAEATPPADEKPAADEVTAAEPAQVVPRYEAALPEDFNDRVSALGTAETEAWQKFNDGDLDQAALQAELSRIANERSELNAIKVKSEISQEMTAQTAAQQWQATINRSLANFAKPEQGGIDYRKDEAKMADLDQFVKLLANKEENSDKPMEWFLAEAHKRVQALHGIAPAPKKDETKDAIKEASASRKPNLEAAPKTLANVPGGEGPGDVGGEFAEVDQLDGEELEAAIGRMTAAQRERYAQAR